MPVRTECRLRLQTTSSGSKLQLERGLWAGDPALRSRIPGVSMYSGVQETSGLWESVVETLWGGANSTLCSGIVRLWLLASPTESSRSWRISTSGWTNKKPSHHMPRLSKNLFQHKSLYLQEFSKKFLYILVSSHLTWLIELTSSFSRLFKTDYPAPTTSRSEQ